MKLLPLTTMSGSPIAVNLLNVEYMFPLTDRTEIYFTSGHCIVVKEILKMGGFEDGIKDVTPRPDGDNSREGSPDNMGVEG